MVGVTAQGILGYAYSSSLGEMGISKNTALEIGFPMVEIRLQTGTFGHKIRQANRRLTKPTTFTTG
jgi:hypothetical protein